MFINKRKICDKCHGKGYIEILPKRPPFDFSTPEGQVFRETAACFTKEKCSKCDGVGTVEDMEVL